MLDLIHFFIWSNGLRISINLPQALLLDLEFKVNVIFSKTYKEVNKQSSVCAQFCNESYDVVQNR